MRGERHANYDKDILGSDQVGIYLAVCGNVVFHPHELNEEALNRIDEYLGLERHPLTIELTLKAAGNWKL